MPLNNWGVDSLFVVKLFTEVRKLKVKILSFTFYLSYNRNQDDKDIWEWGMGSGEWGMREQREQGRQRRIISNQCPMPNIKLDLGETVPFR